MTGLHSFPLLTWGTKSGAQGMEQGGMEEGYPLAISAQGGNKDMGVPWSASQREIWCMKEATGGGGFNQSIGEAMKLAHGRQLALLALPE